MRRYSLCHRSMCCRAGRSIDAALSGPRSRRCQAGFIGCSEPHLVLTRQRPRMFRDAAIATQQADASLGSTGKLAAHRAGPSPLLPPDRPRRPGASLRAAQNTPSRSAPTRCRLRLSADLPSRRNGSCPVNPAAGQDRRRRNSAVFWVGFCPALLSTRPFRASSSAGLSPGLLCLLKQLLVRVAATTA